MRKRIQMLIGVASLLLFGCCNDNEITKLNNRIDAIEQKITSIEELTEQLDYATGHGIKVPLFRIDMEGFWLWSIDNGQSFSLILDQEENRLCAIGPDAVSLKLSAENNLYRLLFESCETSQVVYSETTPYAVKGILPLSYIVFDDRHHQAIITLSDSSMYSFDVAGQVPTGIALLNVAPICLSLGSEASFEFRINPSSAILNLEDGEELFELDCVGELTRSYVSESEHVRLSRIEQVYDSETHQPKSGQYRAVVTDKGNCLEYDDLCALVLTCRKGTSEEYQVSSAAFEVKSMSLETLQTGLPIVLVNTPNAQPVINRTEWMEGATMTIVSPDGEIEYQGLMSVKGRGNTSWGFPKKPLALKLDKKAEILGMKKHKRWCLLANWADRSLMRNAIAFELAKRTDMDWTPSGRHVELVLNGVHQGNYYLCEQIKVDENRVNISNPSEPVTDRGYLMELDTYYDEAHKFRSSVRDLPWQFKDPDEVTEEQQLFVEQYVSDMEMALYDSVRFLNRDFESYMDLGSFADYWMIYEIAQLWEPNHPKSVYMHKDAGGKVQAGPVWDFDLGTFEPRPYYFWVDRNAVYYEQLFLDAGFRQLVRERWNKYRDRFLSVETYVDSLAKVLAPSDQVNFPMWPITINSNNDETLTDYGEVIDRVKQSLREKIFWIDENLPD